MYMHSSGTDSYIRRAVSNVLPRAALGRLVGGIASVPLPEALRAPTYRSFCAVVGCDSEASEGDLRAFRSLSAFMQRRVPTKASNDAAVTSPCCGIVDAVGTAAAFGRINVKGYQHEARDIVGAAVDDPLTHGAVAVSSDDPNVSQSRLWYVVMRLRARDPHSFSSPCDWRVAARRLVPGTLRCPGPSSASTYPRNERVTLVGTWPFGFFSLTAIGAAARRTVTLSFEPYDTTYGVISDARYSAMLPVNQGQHLGSFRLGSAIVLIFEAPDNGFTFLVHPGDEIEIGQPIASIDADIKLVQLPNNTPARRKSFPERFRRAW